MAGILSYAGIVSIASPILLALLSGWPARSGTPPPVDQTCSAAFDHVDVQTRTAATDRDDEGCLIDAPALVWSLTCASRSPQLPSGRVLPLPVDLDLRLRAVPPVGPGQDAVAAMPAAWQDHFEAQIERARALLLRAAIESANQLTDGDPSDQAAQTCGNLDRRLHRELAALDEAFWATQSPPGCPRIARLDEIPLPAAMGDVNFGSFPLKGSDVFLPAPP